MLYVCIPYRRVKFGEEERELGDDDDQGMLIENCMRDNMREMWFDVYKKKEKTKSTHCEPVNDEPKIR